MSPPQRVLSFLTILAETVHAPAPTASHALSHHAVSSTQGIYRYVKSLFIHLRTYCPSALLGSGFCEGRGLNGLFPASSLAPLWCLVWGRCFEMLLVGKLCACPWLLWHLGEQSGRRERPPCSIFQKQCPWEGRPSWVARSCFRDKTSGSPS